VNLFGGGEEFISAFTGYFKTLYQLAQSINSSKLEGHSFLRLLYCLPDNCSTD